VATIYSTRLVAVHDQPGSTPVTYTVPALGTLVVRCIDGYAGPTALGVTFYAKGSAGQVFASASGAALGSSQLTWRGREVLYAGETFSLEADDTADLTASGYLLF